MVYPGSNVSPLTSGMSTIGLRARPADPAAHGRRRGAWAARDQCGRVGDDAGASRAGRVACSSAGGVGDAHRAAYVFGAGGHGKVVAEAGPRTGRTSCAPSSRRATAVRALWDRDGLPLIGGLDVVDVYRRKTPRSRSPSAAIRRGRRWPGRCAPAAAAWPRWCIPPRSIAPGRASAKELTWSPAGRPARAAPRGRPRVYRQYRRDGRARLPARGLGPYLAARRPGGRGRVRDGGPRRVWERYCCPGSARAMGHARGGRGHGALAAGCVTAMGVPAHAASDDCGDAVIMNHTRAHLSVPTAHVGPRSWR